jgi:hypothetical protein
MEANDWRKMQNAIIDLVIISKIENNSDKDNMERNRVNIIHSIHKKYFMKTRASFEEKFNRSIPAYIPNFDGPLHLLMSYLQGYVSGLRFYNKDVINYVCKKYLSYYVLHLYQKHKTMRSVVSKSYTKITANGDIEYMQIKEKQKKYSLKIYNNYDSFEVHIKETEAKVQGQFNNYQNSFRIIHLEKWFLNLKKLT